MTPRMNTTFSIGVIVMPSSSNHEADRERDNPEPGARRNDDEGETSVADKRTEAQCAQRDIRGVWQLVEHQPALIRGQA
jgi:hypothetical protein